MIEDPQLTLKNPSPALFIPLSAKILPSKLAANEPNDILRKNPFCFLASLWIVSLTPFNNMPESLRDITILIKSSVSSSDIIRVLVPDPKIFLCLSASAADAAAVNPNGFCLIV